MADIRIATFDDWEIMWVDGKLAHQDHTISLEDYCDAMGIIHERVYYDFDTAMTEYLDEVGKIDDAMTYDQFLKLVEEKNAQA